MGTYQTVIFDMGNVLISFSHEKMLKQVAQASHLSLETIQDLFLKQGLGLKLEKGEISSQDIYKALSKLSSQPFQYDELIHAGCDIFTSRPEMVETVKQLKRQGLRLLLLSNTNESHFNYILKNYDFLPLFDHWVLSFKLHRVKPEKDIYEAVLSEARTPPENCFYVDDIPEYVAAASELGIQGHVYQTFPQFVKALKNHNILF